MTRVRFFAAAEEATGVDEQVRSEATLGDLRSALLSEYPRLHPVLPHCAVLVGGARVDDAHPLSATDVVDVLPPFAGG